MEFITVKSLGGSIWSFRKDRIEMVCNRFKFNAEELEEIPALSKRDSCAIIRLIGSDKECFCDDSYESIIKQLLEEGLE